LALSGGGFLAAARLGGRAGLAARAAVQPGEELIGQVGGRGTRAIAGERAAERLFPNNEPFIFSEEAAIRGAERVAGGVSDLRSRAGVTGVGAGFPAIEIETEQEQEPTPEDFRQIENRDPLARPERNERMRDRARNRGMDRTDLGPNVRNRGRTFEFETELEQEISREAETIRTQVGLNLESIQQDIFQPPTERPPFEIETPVERPRFETEVPPFEMEMEREQETEAPPFRFETETRREVEPFEFFDTADMGMGEAIDGEGFQAVDTTIRPLQQEPEATRESNGDQSELDEDLERYRRGGF
jgi:hypothetical protein